MDSVQPVIIDNPCIFHKEVIWYVNDIFSGLPRSIRKLVCREFYFAGARWRIEMEHNTRSDDIRIGLQRQGPGHASGRNIRWKIGLKKVDGTIYINANGSDSMKTLYGQWTRLEGGCIIPMTELVQLKSLIAPFNYFTAFCFLSRDGVVSSSTVGTQTKEFTRIGVDKLLLDFKHLLKKEDMCDVTLSVKGKLFQAHKAILCARVPVFEAMFKHEMTESLTGRVTISDCDPDCFQEFLLYVYTGIVHDKSFKNVYSLYNLADKYQLDELKADCANFMGTILSVEIICDVLDLALSHEEAKLVKKCISFFSGTMKEIIKTNSWLTFMKKHPERAQQLLMLNLRSPAE